MKQKSHRESDILLNSLRQNIDNKIYEKKKDLIRSGKLGQVIVENYVRKEYDQDLNNRNSCYDSENVQSLHQQE
jgi:hypothetical protein